MYNTFKLFFKFIFIISIFVKCRTQARFIEKEIKNTPLSVELKGQNLKDSVKIYYIGCGGFLILNGKEGVLIDPYFSNANTFKHPFNELKSDTQTINTFFTSVFNNKRDISGNIKTVLISHSHYDHLADLPFIYKNSLNNKEVAIFGSQTASNIFEAFKLGNPFIVPDTFYCNDNKFLKIITNKDSLFTWIAPNKKIQITPIPSMHAAHFNIVGIKMKIPSLSGHINTIPEKEPEIMSDFKEGNNYNYIIDFLDEKGAINLRIFSNAGAACHANIGFPPKRLLDKKPIDILLLCGANYNQAKNYPDALVEHTHPQFIFVAHWEDFFRPISQIRKHNYSAPNTNIKSFLIKLNMLSVNTTYKSKTLIVKPNDMILFK